MSNDSASPDNGAILSQDRLAVGWREWVSMPEIGVIAIKAKVDTGARTSALHAYHLDTFEHNGVRRVHFVLHPIRRRPDIVVEAETDVVDERAVTNSGGQSELRVVIRTPVTIGGVTWPIELTLTNRETMRFRMLLGRTAMEGRVVVDPGSSFLRGRVRGREIAQRYGVRHVRTRP